MAAPPRLIVSQSDVVSLPNMMKREKKKKKEYISQKTLINQYGLTPRLIEKYFPEPVLRRNPYYSSAAPMKLWETGEVKRILKGKKLQAELEQLKSRRSRRQMKEEAITAFLDSFSLENYIEKGKRIKRKFVLHVGPTNSGKTYDALQKMMESDSGTYLGPLRLLALETYEKLNRLGYPCDLLTGEEAEYVDGARYVASTIELCDFHMEYDAAVIDEAQLIADPYRGSNWTKAICMVRAKEVHVCFAPEALELIVGLMDKLEQEYVIVEHERLAPLIYAGHFKGLNEVETGDCIIAFSRKNVLSIAADIERTGMKASVIYGALPPNARREEVRKFTSGETKVVVATDAIGMGVSLPIRRIIFSTITKYDGEQRRRLTFSELKQIAGRAGRFGIYEEGKVLTMEEGGYVKKALAEPSFSIRRLFIGFPEESLETEFDLKDLLEMWRKLPRNPLFERENVDEAEYLLSLLDKNKARQEKKLTYSLITCPVDTKNDALVNYWVSCANAILSGRGIPEPWFECIDLEGCELQYRAYDIYHQLLRRLDQEDHSLEEKEKICRKIAQLMKEKGEYLRKCRICNRILPISSPYGICETCYKRQFYRPWYEDGDIDDDWEERI